MKRFCSIRVVWVPRLMDPHVPRQSSFDAAYSVPAVDSGADEDDDEMMSYDLEVARRPYVPRALSAESAVSNASMASRIRSFYNEQRLIVARQFQSDRSAFRNVPDDIVLEISSFLAPGDVCRFSCTSMRMERTLDNRRIWEPMLRREFPGLGAIYSLNRSGRSFFGRQLQLDAKQLLLEHHNEAANQALRQRRWRRAERRYRRPTWFLYCCEASCFLPVLYVFFTIGMASVFRMLDEHDSPTLTTFWPLYVIIAFTTLIMLCLCRARYSCYTESHAPMTSSAYENAHGLFKWLMESFCQDRPAAHAAGVVFFLSLCLFALFLTFKVSGAVDMSWNTVFIPIYVAFGVLTLWNAVGFASDEDGLSCAFTWVCLIGPLLAFFILLHVHTETGDLTVAEVLIPIFVIDGLILCSICAALSDGEWDSLPGFCCCFGPIIAFEVLLVVRLDMGDEDTTVSWNSVFVPFWILVAMCGSVTVSVSPATYEDETDSLEALFGGYESE